MTTGSNEELRGAQLEIVKHAKALLALYDDFENEDTFDAERDVEENLREAIKREAVLEAALPKSSPAPVRQPDLVIQRLPDWNWAAFLNETDASCIAIGATEQEALNNGMRELLSRYPKSSPDALREELRKLPRMMKHGHNWVPLRDIDDLLAALAAPSSPIELIRAASDLVLKATVRYSRDQGEPNPTPSFAYEVAVSVKDWETFTSALMNARLAPQVGPVSPEEK